MLSGVIVVPCYNEAQRLDLAAWQRFVQAAPGVRLLMVNDGSQDGTGEMLDRLASSGRSIRVLHLPANGGKAEAVRQGMLSACSTAADFVGFLDADLATPWQEVPRFIDVLRRLPHVQVVLGSRLRLLGRDIRRQRLRRLLGRMFALAASRVIGLPLQDTQCGAKLFRRNALLQSSLEQPFASRWIFDVELLARLKAAYRAAGQGDLVDVAYELPLEQWHEVPGSKLKRSDFLKAIVELAGIYRRYSRGAPALQPAPNEAAIAAKDRAAKSLPTDNELHRAA